MNAHESGILYCLRVEHSAQRIHETINGRGIIDFCVENILNPKVICVCKTYSMV